MSEENKSIYTPKNHASGVGKETVFIDKDMYGDLNSKNPIVNESNFYGFDFPVWDPQFDDRDRFRLEMGKYWDLIEPGSSPGVPVDPSNPKYPGKLQYGYGFGLWTKYWYAHRLKYGPTYSENVPTLQPGNQLVAIEIANSMQNNDLPLTVNFGQPYAEAEPKAFPEVVNLAKQMNAKLYPVTVELSVGKTSFDEIRSAISEWRGLC